MHISELIDQHKNNLFSDSKDKIQFEFQEIGKQLEPFYGKLIWTLFYKPGFTEFKIRKAHEIAQERGIKDIKYLIGIIKKLPY